MVPLSALRRGVLVALCFALTWTGVFAGPAAAQVVPVLTGGTNGLSLWTVDETTQAAQVIARDLTVEPIHLAGYARRDRLRSDLPYVAGLNGPAPRISLPQGGALYRVRHGGQTSILHLRADGSPRLMLAVPDVMEGSPAQTGAAGSGMTGPASGSGLLTWISVSRDGSRALVASKIDAGGELILLDLTGAQSPVSLTAASGPLTINGRSLRVAASRAWFVAVGQLVRIDLTAPSPALAVVDLSGPAGSVVLPELAASDDGNTVAAVTQDPSGNRSVHVVDAAGAGVVVTPVPGHYDTPHYDLPSGPMLAFSPDGSLLAWIHTTVVSRELFVRRLSSVAAPHQITMDQNFADTIDNVGVIGFADANVITFVAGEAKPGSIEQADLFRASFGPGAPSIQNLTLTSGIATPPFTSFGTLEVVDAVTDPRAERLLLAVSRPKGGGSSLLSVRLDGVSGATVLLHELDAPPRLAPAGDRIVIISSPQNVPAPRTVLHLLHPLGTPQPMRTLGVALRGLQLGGVTGSRSAPIAGLVISADPGMELPLAIDLASSTVFPVWPVPTHVAPQLSVTPAGSLVLGLAGPGTPYLFGVLPAFGGAAQLLPVPAGWGWALPF